MDNKKLLKFLYKDIAEIEELFAEKGSEGFDEFEIEFIQSRFKGAKQLIQILSEKENKHLKNIRPRPVAEVLEERQEKEPKKVKRESVQASLSVEEKESLQELSDFEEELKGSEQSQGALEEEKEEIVEEPLAKENSEDDSEQAQVEVEDNVEAEVIAEEQQTGEEENKSSKPDIDEQESGVELDDEEESNNANNRLGDSFSKEKSVNELLGNDDSSKLEYKISNSPVESIKTAIGINDRYQYIRELFGGNADTFAKTVDELDNLKNIEEAVAYLQQNYKWKKNDTSLKFVNLVKRRFPNG